MGFQDFWYGFKRKVKRGYKKVKRFVKRYIRFLVRHTKAKDYSVLFYTIMAFILLIVFILLMGRAFKSIGNKIEEKRAAKTETTTEETTERITTTEDPAVTAHKKLVEEAKKIYEKDKDYLVLVNKENEIPKDYTFEKHTLNCGEIIDERIYDDFDAMMGDLNSAGHDYEILSCYRSKEDQENAFIVQVQKYIDDGMSDEDARKKTKETIMEPGFSEHETGLAADLTGEEQGTSDDFDDKNETIVWLHKNCVKYGFILRYPKDKESITGINYEAWHFRYVGKDAAKFMSENDLTLEEFHTLLK
ncbi:MAG: M15 family metallopeptidase [Lachnospiraceae bacterium]|nr:M15 family metallopeptidase [Lachnospiraceae bacterium]